MYQPKKMSNLKLKASHIYNQERKLTANYNSDIKQIQFEMYDNQNILIIIEMFGMELSLKVQFLSMMNIVVGNC